MADEPQTTPPADDEPGAGPGHETGQGNDPTLHQLAERVDRLAGMFEKFMEGSGQPAEPDRPDIKGEVREAVREIQARDRAKAEKAAEEQSIKEQIGEIKAKLEQAPQEYRRVTQAMGWNRP